MLADGTGHFLERSVKYYHYTVKKHSFSMCICLAYTSAENKACTGQMLSSRHTAAVINVMIYLSHQTSKRYKFILWVEVKPFLVCTWTLFQAHNVTNLITSSHVTPENTKTMHLQTIRSL